MKALRVEAIDLYQFHVPDPAVPFEDSVGEISRLRDEGKVLAVGLSNVELEQIRVARDIVQITSVQNRFNPWDRQDEESGLIRYCEENRITYLPYSPVGGGRRVKLLRENERLKGIGARSGGTQEEVVLAWILSKSPRLVPIPSATRLESIESSVSAESLRLDPSDAEEIEDAFRSLPD